MQPLQICIGPIIRIGRESWCLPFAGFFTMTLTLVGPWSCGHPFQINRQEQTCPSPEMNGKFWKRCGVENISKEYGISHCSVLCLPLFFLCFLTVWWTFIPQLMNCVRKNQINRNTSFLGRSSYSRLKPKCKVHWHF